MIVIYCRSMINSRQVSIIPQYFRNIAHNKNSPPSKSLLKKGSSEQVSNLQNYMRAYRNQVQLPIFYGTSLFQRKAPQRCLTHNSPITLFCIQQKKPLCGLCLHQSSAKKQHQVIAVSQATSQISLCLESIISIIRAQVIPFLTQMLQISSNNIDRVSKEMKSFTKIVEQQYQQLIKQIIHRKTLHLDYCKQMTAKLANQYTAVQGEVKKASNFINEKLAEIQQKKSEQDLLYNFNIANYLCKITSLISSLTHKPSLQINKNIQIIEQVVRKVKETLSFNYSLIMQKQKGKDSTSIERKVSTKAFWKNKKNCMVNDVSEKQLNLQVKHLPMFLHSERPKIPFTPRQNIRVVASPEANSSRQKIIPYVKNSSLDNKNRFGEWKKAREMVKMGD